MLYFSSLMISFQSRAVCLCLEVMTAVSLVYKPKVQLKNQSVLKVRHKGVYSIHLFICFIKI